MTDREGHSVGRSALGGALLSAAVVVAKNVGEYEGGDVVLVLVPLALVVGGGLGAVVGLVLRHRRLGVMWRRRRHSRPEHETRRFDVRDREALEAALALTVSKTTALTVYMCWHGGTGHEYPADVMQAAGRLRERHAGDSDSDYTSLTFMPREDDLADFVVVAPYCDLAYATDLHGDVLLEVSGEGASGRL